MQTSKITVGDIYAVKVGGTLARFRVLRTETVRNMHGTETTVYGELQDATDGRPPGHKINFPPGEIMGPFSEFKELADKRAHEQEAARLKAKREVDRADAVLRAFTKLIGVPMPKKTKQRYNNEPKYDSNEPFYINYSNTIEVNKAGMEILAAFFKIDQPEQEANNVVNLNTTA